MRTRMEWKQSVVLLVASFTAGCTSFLPKNDSAESIDQPQARQLLTNSGLREELLQMRDADQVGRNAIMKQSPQSPEASDALLALDAKHTGRLKEIVITHGWPTISLVGKDGAKAAWLLAQHADADPDFQRHVLKLMEPLVTTGEVNATDFAYLWDRTHEPQRYGTQGSCDENARWAPNEIELPAEVDARRAKMGMPLLAQYIELVSGVCARR